MKRKKLATTLQAFQRQPKRVKPQPPKPQPPKIQPKKASSIHYPTYTASDKILLIGEGNFSFAASLIQHHLNLDASNVWATAYDTHDVTVEKYGSQVDDNIDMITTSGGQVLFEVDATTLHSNKKLRRIGFDVIVFMFPHVGAGIKDKVRNIRANQELLSGFFSSAQQVLRVDNPTAGLHIAIKTTPPYDEWDIKAQARANGLVCARSCVFDADVFPGYGHRRTIGFEEGLSKGNNEELQGKQCRVFMFEQKQETS